MTVREVAYVFTQPPEFWYYESMNNPLHQAKTLFDRGSREAILDFLQKMDPNGSYTDNASYDEGLEPLTFDEALIYLEETIQELEAVPV